MKNFVILLFVIAVSCKSSDQFNNGWIAYHPTTLNAVEKSDLLNSIKELEQRYDSSEYMLTRKINGWNYHTDTLSGLYHEVRASVNYALMLLDYDSAAFRERSFRMINKIISLQDQDTLSRSCGVWPYYLEEPLATKKSPIDFNWADFNGVTLLDIWMGHQSKLPAELKDKIRHSLILAAKSIQKRNMSPDYTNIAIMGTYVTYMVSHLFDIQQMQDYSAERLENFYNYTLLKKGFTEYNSPTYTIIAIDELQRMKNHMVEPSAKAMVDSLYNIGWKTIATHYHFSSGQWTGPHSRSYSTIVKPSFYALLQNASNGKLDFSVKELKFTRLKHQIPSYLLPYFQEQTLPRTQVDTFENSAPQLIGTCFLTNDYTFSTANRSSFWNQRRPFLVYWGTRQEPKYLQARFLHDGYDFSSASIYCSQENNEALCGLNFVTNGGDKHINLDVLKDSRFEATDLRLRFEFSGVDSQKLNIKKDRNFIHINSGKINFTISLLFAGFDGNKGEWKPGGNKDARWIDYVFYEGEKKEFQMDKIAKAAMVFAFKVDSKMNTLADVSLIEKQDTVTANWKTMSLTLPVRPVKIKRLPQNYPNNL